MSTTQNQTPAKSAKPLRYCEPYEAGLASEAKEVARRIGRMIDAMDAVSGYSIIFTEGHPDHGYKDLQTVKGSNIVDDVRRFRMVLLENLERDGWTFSVKGNKAVVRPPGHPHPFPLRHIIKWSRYGTSGRYTYWKGVQGTGRDFYQVTTSTNPPADTDNGGYFSLDALRKAKGDHTALDLAPTN